MTNHDKNQLNQITVFSLLNVSVYIKGHQGFFIVRSKVVLLMFRKGFLEIFFCRYLSFWC